MACELVLLSLSPLSPSASLSWSQGRGTNTISSAPSYMYLVTSLTHTSPAIHPACEPQKQTSSLAGPR